MTLDNLMVALAELRTKVSGQTMVMLPGYHDHGVVEMAAFSEVVFVQKSSPVKSDLEVVRKWTAVGKEDLGPRHPAIIIMREQDDFRRYDTARSKQA